MPNSIRIIVDTSEIDKLVTGIGEALAKLKSNGTIGKVFEKELLDSTDRAFKNETDPNTGEKWPEWAPSYVRSLMRSQNAKTKGKGKGRKGNAPAKMHKKLQLKGMQGGGLRSTIQTTTEDEQATIGSNLDYARIHQLGGMAGRGLRAKIPARPYLGLDERGQNSVKRKVGQLLRQALASAAANR